MKIFVIFAIGHSSIWAYGNVTGYVEVPSFPKVGDQVRVLHDEIVRAIVGFSGICRVTMVLLPQKESYAPEEAWIVLDGVMVSSREMARILCAKLEEESALSCGLHPGA
jgi:hypothetical protein